MTQALPPNKTRLPIPIRSTSGFDLKSTNHETTLPLSEATNHFLSCAEVPTLASSFEQRDLTNSWTTPRAGRN